MAQELNSGDQGPGSWPCHLSAQPVLPAAGTTEEQVGAVHLQAALRVDTNTSTFRALFTSFMSSIFNLDLFQSFHLLQLRPQERAGILLVL